MQRLLSLDKSFDSLDERIQEAARVLDITLERRPNVKDVLSSQPRRARAGHDGRRELVVRWLLEKLKNQPEVRLNALAWELLRRTIQDMTVSSAVRVLGTTSITNVAIAALNESFPEGNLKAAFSRSQQVVEEVKTTKESARKEKSNKRKRSTPDTEIQSQGANPDNAARVFMELANLLFLLVDRSKPSEQSMESIASSQMQSLLRLEGPKMIDLVQHWFEALILLCRTTYDNQLEDASKPAYISSLMDLLVAIWTLQPPAAAASELFCKQCLWPATLLLSVLRQPHLIIAWQSSPNDVKPIRDAVRVLERMLAQHLFVPARTQFFSARDTPRNKQEKPSVEPSSDIESLLTPLKTEIAALDTQTASVSVVPGTTMWSLAQDAIAFLLNIALRCANTSTPKRRITERPWLDAVFTALFGVAGPAPSALLPAGIRRGDATLATMLDTVLDRGLSLSTETLVTLVDEHCHLRLADDIVGGLVGELVDGSDSNLLGRSEGKLAAGFSVASKALAMDANVFVGSNSGILGRKLIATLSLLANYPLVSSDSPLTNPELIPSGRFARDHCAIPLLRAYARVRNLPSFLRECIDSLHKMPSPVEWSVWADPELQRALREVLESSMTVTQIKEFLESIAPPSSEKERVYAETVILDAVIFALHSDAVVEQLTPTLTSVVQILEAMLDEQSGASRIRTTHIWSMLSRLYVLLYPRQTEFMSDSERVNKLFDHAWDAIVPAVNTRRDKKYNESQEVFGSGESRVQLQEANAAFAFVAQVCDLFRLRRDGSEDLIRSVMLKACGTHEEGTLGFYAFDFVESFAEAMVKHPHLLTFVERRPEFFRDLLPQSFDPSNLESQRFLSLFHALRDAILLSGDNKAKEEFFERLFESLPFALAQDVFLRWPLTGMTRQQREQLLDRTAKRIEEHSGSWQHNDAYESLHRGLSLMIKLLEIPNATAHIAVEPAALWSMAKALDDNAVDETALQLLDEVYTLLYQHIFDTKEQERSRTLISKHSELVADFVQSSSSYISAPSSLRLVSTFVSATQRGLPESVLAGLSHQSPTVVNAHVAALWKDISRFLDTKGTTANTAGQIIPWIIHAYTNLPSAFIGIGSPTTREKSDRFSALLPPVVGLKVSSKEHDQLLPVRPNNVRVQCFEQICRKHGPMRKEIYICAAELLKENLSPQERHRIVSAFADAMHRLSEKERVEIINAGLRTGGGASGEQSAVHLTLVQQVIASFVSVKDVAEEDSAAILPGMLKLLRVTTDHKTHSGLARCIAIILRNKVSAVSTPGRSIRRSSPLTPRAAVPRQPILH